MQIFDKTIPGTILDRGEMGNVTGLEFLEKIFYISDGIMLTQIRSIAGIDGSTLQNWTKRGWVANAPSKKYNIDQVAHILIINMLRGCMQLERIAFLIRYINGKVDDRSDDIISDSRLYDYICRIIEKLLTDDIDISGLRECISETTTDYEEKIAGARRRLNTALEIIVIAYYAAIIKRASDNMLEEIMKK